MASNRYKLLIFDWDGTLIDSIERIVTSLQAASHQICQIDISAPQARDVIGLGLNEAVQKLHPDLGSDLILKISEAYKHHYINDNTVKEDLFDGVSELLTKLKEKGYCMAVATGKSRIGFDHSINFFAMNGLFHTTQCAGENKSKPHPQMLFKILHQLKISAENAVMIGDSQHDLKMAQNAGMNSIGVTHGVHSATELSGFNPLVCLDKITDLSDFLQHNIC